MTTKNGLLSKEFVRLWLDDYFAIPTENYVLGDADGDDEVTVLDVTVIQRTLVEIPVVSFSEKAADIDGNGLDITDATMIQRYLADIFVPYPVGESLELSSI